MKLKIQQLIEESLKYIAYTYQFIWRQKMIEKTQSIFKPRTSYLLLCTYNHSNRSAFTGLILRTSSDGIKRIIKLTKNVTATISNTCHQMILIGAVAT